MTDVVLNNFQYIIQFLIFYNYLITMSQIVSNIRYNKKNKLIILICSFLVTLTGIVLKGIFPFNTLAMMLVIFIFLKFVLKIKTSKTILIDISIVILLIIFEILVVSIATFILKKPAIEMIGDSLVNFCISVSVSFLLYIFTITFNRILINKKRIKYCIVNFDKKYLKIILYILLLNFIPQAIIILFNRYNYSILFLSINFIQLFSISIFLLWYIANLLEKEKAHEQLKILEMDNKTLIGMVDGVRTIKHDFNNIFQAINGYICSKQYDELNNYILKIMKECNIINTLSIINKDIFDDPAIYGVVRI